MLADNWCRFVLNEGIIPASLARFFKQNDANRANAKLLAQILKARESFSDVLYPELTALTKRAFLSDEELCNWLASVDSILTIIVSFAEGDSNTKDILNGAFISFIKSCPLVSESVKDAYIKVSVPSAPVVMQTRKYRRDSNDNPLIAAKKKAFGEYLESNNYSPPTANSYRTSVNLGSDFLGADFAGRNLWEIDDPAEMERIFNKLKNDEPQTEEDKKLRQDYKKKDDDTHNALSNGLKRYLEFLRFRATQGE